MVCFVSTTTTTIVPDLKAEIDDNIFADVLVNVSNSSKLNLDTFLSTEANAETTTVANLFINVITKAKLPSLIKKRKDEYSLSTILKKSLKTVIFKNVQKNVPTNPVKNLTKATVKPEPSRKNKKLKALRSIDNLIDSEVVLGVDSDIFADVEISIYNHSNFSLPALNEQNNVTSIDYNSIGYEPKKGLNETNDYFFGHDMDDVSTDEFEWQTGAYSQV